MPTVPERRGGWSTSMAETLWPVSSLTLHRRCSNPPSRTPCSWTPPTTTTLDTFHRGASTTHCPTLPSWVSPHAPVGPALGTINWSLTWYTNYCRCSVSSLCSSKFPFQSVSRISVLLCRTERFFSLPYEHT